MNPIKFSIVITTKNRLDELKITLKKIDYLFKKNDVEVLLYDDGSNDGTSDYIKENYPGILLFRNEKAKGLIYNRNRLNKMAKGDYLISLDDDLHFLVQNPLEIIENYFEQNSRCGVVSFRIFWSKQEPESHFTNDQPEIVKSFAGGAHGFRKTAWDAIPDYPDWYEFYGEETFAAMNLFKRDWEVHYLPEILVNHRVELKKRAIANNDFGLRFRRAIRADWFNMLLLYPLSKIPRILLYSIWMQYKTKIFKGDFRVIKPLFLAKLDLITHFRKIVKYRNPLPLEVYQKYTKLKEAKIYWKPEN
ncbi:glycosyltransferase family 2 protein [Flavobacterium phycosphaerae]|uniref:glycosyltransferase family 2 protein n=1 Tax=Flavobacterium phycosphaerae TaxID=2697515 RepID=UPI00138A362D|nr:glycosyltransferase family 2 protein [Flavobacterium phycosphaerae]